VETDLTHVHKFSNKPAQSMQKNNRTGLSNKTDGGDFQNSGSFSFNIRKYESVRKRFWI